MASNAGTVFVACEHHQVMAHTERGQECIDGANLHPRAPAAIPQARRSNMIVAVGNEERDRGKSIQDVLACLGARKALKNFLENEPRRDNRLSGFDGANERTDLSRRSRRIAPKCERPDARVDEESQSRLRSAL